MFVAKWYTRASRVRIVIAKFDGRWKLPGGPYPIPELVALVGGILATLFLLPRLGQLVAGDADSYRYLAESIRMHPGQQELKALMKNAGFGHVDFHNLSAGVVALHVGIKI